MLDKLFKPSRRKLRKEIEKNNADVWKSNQPLTSLVGEVCSKTAAAGSSKKLVKWYLSGPWYEEFVSLNDIERKELAAQWNRQVEGNVDKWMPQLNDLQTNVISKLIITAKSETEKNQTVNALQMVFQQLSDFNPNTITELIKQYVDLAAKQYVESTAVILQQEIKQAQRNIEAKQNQLNDIIAN